MACEEDGQGIGAEVLPPEDIIDFTFTDTTSIIIETIQQDSINTYRPADLLFGNYADPSFGRIKATIYTEFFSRSGLDLGDPDDLILDSVILGIGIRSSYGRLDQEQNLEVYELDEAIPDDADATSNRTLQIKGENLAQGFRFTYDSSSAATQLIFVKLDRQFGEKILKAGNEILGDVSTFKEFFKGFSISTEEVEFFTREPGAIFSVDVIEGTPRMLLYYQRRENGQFTVQEPEPFPVPVSNPRFTSIKRTDVDGKLLEMSTTRPELLDQYELIQAGAFVKNFVKFPHIDKLGLVSISQAELVLSVDTTLTGSTGAFRPPPQILPILADADGNEVLTEFGFPVDLDLSFAIDARGRYNATTGTYSFDLSGYLQRVVSKQQENHGFILHPSSTNFTMNRAVFGGTEHPTLKAKLNLTYSSLPR